MAIADFEALCMGFCELAGADVVAPEPDPHGALSLTVCFQGVDVTLLQIRSRPDIAYAMIDLGTMPNRFALDGWRALLEANLALLGQDAPVFSRQPVTGDVVLQRALSLPDLTINEVLQRVQWLVDIARQWPAQCEPAKGAPPAVAPDSFTALA